MSYSPTTWANGDTITAEKLNKMEQGIAGGGVFWVADNEAILNKTWQEVANAYDAGSLIVYKTGDSSDGMVFFISAIWGDGEEYGVVFNDTSDGTIRFRMFIAASQNDYPVYTQIEA